MYMICKHIVSTILQWTSITYNQGTESLNNENCLKVKSGLDTWTDETFHFS